MMVQRILWKDSVVKILREATVEQRIESGGEIKRPRRRGRPRKAEVVALERNEAK